MDAVKSVTVPEVTDVTGVLMNIAGVTGAITSTEIMFEVAVGWVLQIVLLVMKQVITAPSAGSDSVSVASVPTGSPFIRHSKAGPVPPFCGVAVKTISSPAHTLVR